MVRNVLRYPDNGLELVCRAVPPGRGEATIRDLVETMRAHRGCVGLAAPQIGAAIRIVVVDAGYHRLATSSNGLVVLANPRILEARGSRVGREGCLSLPEITVDVARAERIHVSASNLCGPFWSEGFEARAIQRELDHLDGILILDRMASPGSVHRRREDWVGKAQEGGRTSSGPRDLGQP